VRYLLLDGKMHNIQDIKNTIIQGNAADVMQESPAGSVDLTITSPPYGDLRDYTKEKAWEFNTFMLIANELYRITKEGGIVVWVVGDQTINGSETGESFRQALYFKDIGFNLHDTMIYEKNGANFPDKHRYYNIFEYMFVLSKGTPKTINLLKDRKNKWFGVRTFGHRTKRKKDGTLKRGGIRTTMAEYGVRFNIWKYNVGFGYSSKEKTAYKHPAIFPEKLAQDHIRSWSNKGDLILDPMCGSGTVCKKAIEFNRDFIGIDISKEYCELAKQRISNAEPSLF